MLKKAIRFAIKVRRKLHTTSSRREKDEKIISELITQEAFRHAKIILFYAPIPDEKEVDTWSLIEKYLDEKTSGKTIILPKISMKNKEMTLYRIATIEDVKPSRYGIPEPISSCETIAPEDIDLAIIPGIVFDKRGNRIGFGHGFYDRLLKKLKCPKIALAYDFQILHAIPRHEHDMPVDLIITEKKMYNANESHSA